MAWFLKALRLWPWLAAISSGLLYAFCFAPFNQAWLCWIALTPLLAAIWFSGADSKRRWLRSLLLGYVSGGVFFSVVFSWLGSLGSLFQSVPLYGLPVLLSVYLGLYPAFWSWLAGLIRPREAVTAETGQQPAGKWDEMLMRAGQMPPPLDSPWLKSFTNLRLAFCLACVWVALEWIRGWLLGGFGWNGLGIALHSNWPIIQIAEFTGVSGLSFVVVFANVIAVCTVRRLILEARSHRMRPHFDLTLTVATLVGLLGFGLRTSQSTPPAIPLRVAAVQPNIPQREKFDARFTPANFQKLAHLSEIAQRTTPPPDLLIWPESAMPDAVRDEAGLSHRFIADFSAGNKTDLLLGSVDQDESGSYNAALLVSGSGQPIQLYRKMHLVPFGEYVPLRHSFPPFGAIAGKWVPGDFDAGTEHVLFHLARSTVLVAPLICFEDTVGDLVRKFVLKGANLLVDVTNDGWFLHSAGSQQHLANAIFRCVETRRPMVRASNTGVTCFINEFGRVTQILQDENGGTFTEGVLAGDANVTTETRLTFYVRHGELFAHCCVGVSGLVLIFLGLRFVSRRKRDF